MKDYKILPGMKIKILDRETLIKAGYEENNDPLDFLNLIAGKEVTVLKTYEENGIYTCEEYPECAIYKVFIEKIDFDSFKPTLKNIAFIIGRNHETVARNIKKGLNKMAKLVNEDAALKECLL